MAASPVADDPLDVGLRLERLSKSFGDFVAVRDVDLHIRRGEFLTLLGPSGSGKTTLLLMIAGFLEPTAGDLFLDGRSIRSLMPEKRNFGMVFQGYALFPHMTVRRNIAYSLEVRKQSRAAITARVEEMLQLVQLEPFGDRLPHQLSGGQQQRVALARALSFDPRVLLLDEPLGALDKKLRGELQTQLKHLHRKVGTTFVYVTHDQEEALSMSDRVVIMNHGATIQIGTPTELYERPTTAFAADFLGKSNFLRGTVTGADAGSATVEIAGRSFRQDDPAGRLTPGAAVTLALRPEKIDIVPAEDSAGGANRLSGRIVDVTYFGAILAVTVMTEAAGEITAEMKAWSNPLVPKDGQDIFLTWTPEAAVVVDDTPLDSREPGHESPTMDNQP
ncbi:MAG: ABC transporter ATP-binding protein [Alphaproteobacteria bacterium]